MNTITYRVFTNQIIKYVVIFLSLFSGFPLFAQRAFTLTITVPPTLNTDNAYLRIWDKYSLHRYKTMDSVSISENHIFFQGSLRNPSEEAILFVKKSGVEKFYLRFVLDSGKNEIAVKKIDTDDYTNKLTNTTFSTPSNRIGNQLDSLYNIYRKHKGDEEYLRYYGDELAVLASNPSTFYTLVSLRTLAGEAGRNQEKLLQTFTSLDKNLRSSPLGIETDSVLTSEIAAIKRAKAGHPAPEFKVLTDKGTWFSNKNLRHIPYVIAFSATWCIPCQVYQKKLLSIYHKYKHKHLQVVYFNLDDNVQRWKKEIAEHKLDWLNVSERTKFKDSKIAKQFYATSIPLYLVVNKDGQIVYNGNEINDEDYALLEKAVASVVDNN